MLVVFLEYIITNDKFWKSQNLNDLPKFQVANWNKYEPVCEI